MPKRRHLIRGYWPGNDDLTAYQKKFLELLRSGPMSASTMAALLGSTPERVRVMLSKIARKRPLVVFGAYGRRTYWTEAAYLKSLSTRPDVAKVAYQKLIHLNPDLAKKIQDTFGDKQVGVRSLVKSPHSEEVV